MSPSSSRLQAALNTALTTALQALNPTLPARKPGSPQVVIQGAPNLTFAASGSTITRDTGSWLTDGFAVGYVAHVMGSASNDVITTVSAATATVLTVAASLTDEGPSQAPQVVGWPDTGAPTRPGSAQALQNETAKQAAALAAGIATAVVNEITGNAAVTVAISTSQGALQTSTASGHATDPPASAQTLNGTVS